MGQLIYCYARDFVEHKSGAESYIHAHCLAADRFGVRSELFSLGRRDEVVDLGFAKIVRNRSTGREYRSEYVQYYKRFFAGAIVRRLENEPGPHVIHSFGSWAAAAQDATDRLREKNVKVSHVATCWELMGPHTRSKMTNQLVRSHPLKYLRQRFVLETALRSTLPAERDALRSADVVVTNYRRLTNLIHEEYGAEINVVELPYSSMTAFEPIEENYPVPEALSNLEVKDGPVVVCTSRQAPRKGVDILIRALAALRDEGVSFRAVIVGRGALLSAHRSLVQELGLTDRVAMPGRVPDVREYLAHADVHALPSIAEGSGSVSTLEALQFNVAAISTAVDGMLEDLTDNVDSLLVEVGSVESFAAGLRALLTDEALRMRLSQAGVELYRRRFSAEAATRALGEFYAGLGLEVRGAAVPAA